ncbi:Gfo/Idh/MocA family protein [Marinobacter sp. V034]|uniref:Gfo/Idh/MocA family protein n=1 Tax=Marinobacter sp. V034 TaxID=3459610 RepID=UPI0040446AD1
MTSAHLKTALVVGSGSIAKRHIKNLRQQFPDSSVVCVSSTGRKVNASEVGASSVAANLDIAISMAPDFAIVASPASYHLNHANQLLAANIPVLIEKPLCVLRTELEAFRLTQFSSCIGVAYNLRFMPAARIVKRLLDEEAIGKVSTVFVEVGQYLPDWRPESDYRTGVSARKDLGGGALLELSHELDYINWFFGPFSRSLGVMRSTGALETDVEDTVEALLERRDGLIAHIHLDFLQRQASRSFKAVGELGTIVWDLMYNDVKLLRPNGVIEQVCAEPSYDRNQMYIDQVNAFVDFVHGKATFESTLNSAMRVMSLVESIRASSEQSAWVDVESVS